MSIEIEKQVDDLNLFKKRMEIVVGAKLRENDRTKSAIIVQDRIRNKIKGWNGTEEIRKWREKRAS